MTAVLIPAYLLYLGVAVALAALAHRLRRRYPLPFLDDFFFAVVFYCAYVFVNFVGGIFGGVLLGGVAEGRPMTLLGILAYPALFTALFFMLGWAAKVLEKPLPRGLLWAYWIAQGAVFFWALVETLGRGSGSAGKTFLFGFPRLIFLETILFYLIFIGLFFFSTAAADPVRRTMARGLALSYLAAESLILVFADVLKVPNHLSFAADFLIVPSLLAAVHLPALLFLGAFLRAHGRELVPSPRQEEELSAWLLAHGITRREGEVVALILQGKSNREIGEALFISEKTVKNIVSSIFQKAAVKSRARLICLLRDAAPPLAKGTGIDRSTALDIK